MQSFKCILKDQINRCATVNHKKVGGRLVCVDYNMEGRKTSSFSGSFLSLHLQIGLTKNLGLLPLVPSLT